MEKSEGHIQFIHDGQYELYERNGDIFKACICCIRLLYQTKAWPF